MIPERGPEKAYVSYAIVLLAFSGVCFGTLFYLGGTVSTPINAQVLAEDSTVGPFTVPHDNTVFEVVVDEKLPIRSTGEVWNSITVSLLGANREFLMGWSDEVWSAAGRDAEGAWRESQSRVAAKITIPKKGPHYLRFESEGNIEALPELRVLVREKRGSTPIFIWLGSLSLVGALVCGYLGNKELFDS